MRIITRYVAREFTLKFLPGPGSLQRHLPDRGVLRTDQRLPLQQSPLAFDGAYFLNKIPSHAFPGGPRRRASRFHPHPGDHVQAQRDHGHEIRGDRPLVASPIPILGVVGMIFVVLLGMNEYVVPSCQSERPDDHRPGHPQKKARRSFQAKPDLDSRAADHLQCPALPPGEESSGRDYPLPFQPAIRAAGEGGRPQRPVERRKVGPLRRFRHGLCPEGRRRPEKLSGADPFPAARLPSISGLPRRIPNEMNYRELKEYVRKIERDGYNASKYRTAMYACISFPFISVIMAFLGIPLALRKERGAGTRPGDRLQHPVQFYLPGGVLVYPGAGKGGKPAAHSRPPGWGTSSSGWWERTCSFR